MMMHADTYCPWYYFDKDEQERPIAFSSSLDQPRQPVYAEFFPSALTPGAFIIAYYMVFRRDNGTALLGLDAHDGDYESVLVEISSAGALLGVCYRPHGEEEHFWIRDHDDVMRITDNGRHGPAVYVSRGKHASYPVSGKIWRLFGIGTDICESPIPIVVTLICINEQTDEWRAAMDRSVLAQRFRHVSGDFKYVDYPEIRLKDVATRMAVSTSSITKTVSKWWKKNK